MNTPKGYLALLLHAHLPYVRHPEKSYAMEENWFFEALSETYIPLLSYLENLHADGVPFKITMSMSPTLCAMLDDELLQSRYAAHLEKLIDLAQKEARRTRYDNITSRTANMYLNRYNLCEYVFNDKYDRNIINGFKKLQDAGVLEIITCAATHGYLPNMRGNYNAVRAQIEIGVRSYEKFFGRAPLGFWLPECGYYEGLEPLLDKCGVRYIILESHGLLNAHPAPATGVYAPVKIGNTQNVFAFARDQECSRQVWSAEFGYPGDPHYREYHKDIGYELDMRYIAPYIDPAGIRVNTGIKYHRVTDKQNAQKEFYDHEAALARAVIHAADFMNKRVKQIEDLARSSAQPPIVAAPYDAELFGHWWYEGPEWLNYLIRNCALEQNIFELTTPSEYLDKHGAKHICSPTFSSWGDGGYSHVWLNESNEWIYPHVHRIEDKMVECARKFYNTDTHGVTLRTLNQMARELMLAQSSDWAFILHSGTTVEYATRRIKEHVSNFIKLYDGLQGIGVDVNFLHSLEKRHSIFPDIDFRVFA